MASMKTRCKDTDFFASRQTETGFPRNLGSPVRATENARVPLPNAFSHLLWADQLEISLATLLVFRRSTRHVFIDLMCQVRFQLVGQTGVLVATLKKFAKAHTSLSSQSLFLPQRFHWIHPAGSPGGYKARQQCRYHKHKNHGRKGQRVRGPDARNQMLQ